MIKVTVYNQQGDKIGETNLPSIFEADIKKEVVKLAVVSQQANNRQPLAHVKTRSEVRGGGRKPWRQKGTGRARHGSIRSPLWKGGGKTFGPRNVTNFSKNINKKVKQKALAMALSDKAGNNKVIVLDKLDLAEAKTKSFNNIIDKLPIEKRSILTILPKADVKMVRATNNLKKVKTILADSLNVVDVINHNYLLLPKPSLDVIKNTFNKIKISPKPAVKITTKKTVKKVKAVKKVTKK
ncbi:50S ribosomal protein L4 [Patescibacteria group bacterium]